MGYVTDPVHEVKEGLQEVRRGEGIVWKVNVSGWEIPPTSPSIAITRERDSQTVTSSFTATTTPTVSQDGKEMTLPEIAVPADAELGTYRLDLPFEAGGFSPGRPFIRFFVKV